MKSVGIIGGGIFGLYAAVELLRKGYHVDLFEQSSELGISASKVNQARLHLGFHYPRSIDTAQACIDGFIKFQSRFPKAVNNKFRKYYAIAKNDSKVSADEYLEFCNKLGLEYRIVEPGNDIVNSELVDLVIEVAETAFDWKIIVNTLEQQIIELNGNIYLNHKIIGGNVKKSKKQLLIENSDHEFTKVYDVVVNATYANINNILHMFSLPEEPLEFELCEMALVKVPEQYNNVGVTIMDGEFSSIMPFGLSGYHTISHVKYTPHFTSKTSPKFSHYSSDDFGCYSNRSANPQLPKSNFYKMKDFAMNYIPYVSEVSLVEPMFTVKTILQNQESTDARPTMVINYESAIDFYTIFSGKVDTVIEMTNDLLNRIGDKR